MIAEQMTDKMAILGSLRALYFKYPFSTKQVDKILEIVRRVLRQEEDEAAEGEDMEAENEDQPGQQAQ